MEIRLWARDHVLALTTVLSAVSLALVFSAALQILPSGALPQWDLLLEAIPHFNAVVSLAAIGTIVSGIRAIKADQVKKHRAFMLASFLLFAAFLGLYLYRVAVHGPSSFPGPQWVRLYVYFPILLVHIGLAVLCVPFVFYALLSAGTRPIKEIYESNHRRAGRIAAALWLISFSMGLVIYALLYHIY
jgi:putative membrane protein